MRLAAVALLVPILCLVSHAPAAELRGTLNASDFRTPDSLTAGIQEAIDALPAGGGVVYVPAGTYEINAAVIIKPNTVLRGDGPATVLRQGPTFMVELVEDAPKGQDYVVVKETSRIRPGMLFALGQGEPQSGGWDRQETLPAMDFRVDRVEGDKVFCGFRSGIGLSRGLKFDLEVAKKARLVKSHTMLVPTSFVTIEDMTLDGNGRDQSDDPICFRMGNHTRNRAVYAVGETRQIYLRKLVVRDFAYEGIGTAMLDGAITDCEISGCRGNAIHFGPIDRVLVAENRIHHNGWDGIYFCSTAPCSGIIIRANMIHENGRCGISGIGINVANTTQFEDKHVIIAENVIAGNKSWGISTGGPPGGRELQVANNLIYNNGRGGISLDGARFCTVTGNRLFDTRCLYEKAALTADAASGTKTIRVRQFDMAGDPAGPPVPTPPVRAGDDVVLSQSDGTSEENTIAKIEGLTITLRNPLKKGYAVAEGAVLSLPPRQRIGISVDHCPWDKYYIVADHNLIAGNNCVGSPVGIAAATGLNNRVFGNLGRVVEKAAPERQRRKSGDAVFRQQYWPEQWPYSVGGRGGEGR